MQHQSCKNASISGSDAALSTYFSSTSTSFSGVNASTSTDYHSTSTSTYAEFASTSTISFRGARERVALRGSPKEKLIYFTIRH
jgi:hypothetical protein